MKHLKLFEGFADIDVICKKKLWKKLVLNYQKKLRDIIIYNFYRFIQHSLIPSLVTPIPDDAEFTFTTSLSLNLDCNVLIN